MTSGVYCITNKENGKKYIGSTINLVVRQKSHFKFLRLSKHHSKYLQHAYDKYGEQNFDFSTLVYCEPLELLRYEQFFIDTQKPEYNMCPTAGNRLGMKHNEESRRKMSEASKNRVITSECRKKISAAMKGRKLSKEHREKLGESHKGVSFSDERKMKLSDALMGNKNSLGHRHSEQTRKKQSEIMRIVSGHKQTDETKQKIGESRKRAWSLKKANEERIQG